MLLMTSVLALALSGPPQAHQPPAPADPQEQLADAKEPPTPPHTGIRALFGDLGEDIKVAHLGMDLLQAQILTEFLIEPIKFASHRLRPDGSDYQSFPSGYAAVTLRRPP